MTDVPGFPASEGQDASASEDLVRQLREVDLVDRLPLPPWVWQALAGSAGPRPFGPSSEATVSAKGWRSFGESSEWPGSRVEY